MRPYSRMLVDSLSTALRTQEASAPTDWQVTAMQLHPYAIAVRTQAGGSPKRLAAQAGGHVRVTQHQARRIASGCAPSSPRNEARPTSVEAQGLPPDGPDAAPYGQVDAAEEGAEQEDVLELQVPGPDVHRGLAGPVVRDRAEQVAQEGQRQCRQGAGHACGGCSKVRVALF